MTKSVCFILMPFGTKPDTSGRLIDFNCIYQTIFKAAIEATGLLPIRADEEQSHGFIHKLMYERLLLSEYAIADLTILNANVYYELGVRHAARPATTIMTMAGQAGLPFDVAGLRVLPYSLDSTGKPSDPAGDCTALADRLNACIGRDLVDSPLYQLVDGLKPPPIDRERTDLFREHAAYSEDVKSRLATARAKNEIALVESIAKSLGEVSGLEAGVAIDILLSYRAVGAYQKMLQLVAGMDRTLSRTTLVREQLAFAQNRIGQSREAEETLKEILRERGPSSETNGLLGRVYKDRWQKATKAGDIFPAKAHLKQAIEAYLEGFEADWRDAYPGINAVMLMEIANDPRRQALIPVVRYSVERRLARKGQADYWDHATRLELAVLADDADRSSEALGDVLAGEVEKWQLETTAENVRLIADARRSHEGAGACASFVLDELTKRISDLSK
jgi:tetratricopeptide (TPR) repeat protein